jgi:uncharacterized membrane protein
VHPGDGVDRHGRRHDENFSHGRPVGGYPAPPTISPGGWKVVGGVVAFFVFSSVASGVVGMLRRGGGSSGENIDPWWHVGRHASHSHARR